jgi:hypothetical protein
LPTLSALKRASPFSRLDHHKGKPVQPHGPPPGHTVHKDIVKRCSQHLRDSNLVPDSVTTAGRTNTIEQAMARNIEAAQVDSEDEWVSRFGCANPDCGFLRHSKESVSDSHCCKRCCELDTHWRSDVLHQTVSDQDTRRTRKPGKKCEGLSAQDAFIASLQQAATTATETPMWRPK